MDIEEMEREIKIIGENVAELESMENQNRLEKSHWEIAAVTFQLCQKWEAVFNTMLKNGSNAFRIEKVYIGYKALKLIWNRFIKTDIGYITVRGY